MTTKKRFWAIPLGLLLLLIAAILALPGLVASNAHRATIEALASHLTGRSVHIGGKLSLDLFPEPRLIANQITIGGPDHETITATSLTLDIAIGALLRGRLSAQNLTLQSPDIAFPWPLPGGPASIAPPPWLATLHAQINDGRVSLGGALFEHVDADIFTGADGAVSVSGTGTLLGQPIDLSLGLGAVDAAGGAALTIDAKAGGGSVHLSGHLNGASAFTGAASLDTGPLTFLPTDFADNVTGTAQVSASDTAIALSQLNLAQAGANLRGTAELDLQKPLLRLNLAGSGLRLPTLGQISPLNAQTLPVHLNLDASNSTLAGVAVPQLHAQAEWSPAGLNIITLSATLPGSATLNIAGTVDGTGHLNGRLALDSSGFPDLLTAIGSPVTAPDAWRQTALDAAVAGTLDRPVLTHLAGTLGANYVTGAGVLDFSNGPPSLAGMLHFDQLDLGPLAAAFGHLPAQKFGADLEITADSASYGATLKCTRLLIDASLHGQLVVRRVSAALYNGVFAASFTVSPDGAITAARAMLSLPSAAPLATLIPAAYQVPAAVVKGKLAAAVIAAGPPDALATSATLTLGDFDVTANPVVNLAAGSAAGPITLRHPSAIAAFKAFGLNAGLPWPGAGSVSLRANMLVSGQTFGLPDFVLSLGDLTATGNVIISPDDQVTAQIDADTLAFPAWPAELSPFWNFFSGARGRIFLSANRVLLAGTPVLGPVAASLALQPNSDVFTLSHAALAGGNLTGNIDATTAPATPPSLIGQFAATGIDPAQLNFLTDFPLAIPTGALAATGKFTAAGYGPRAWAATLAGPMSFSAKSGTVSGFDLAALSAALTQPNRAAALKAAALAGTSAFDTLSLAGDFDHGIFAIAAASLQSAAGSATATGNIDLADQGVSLNLLLTPAVIPPPSIGLALDGSWASPTKIPALRPGLDWIASP